MGATFASLFGGNRESSDIVGIAVHAVRAGYAVVAVKPGTKHPACTLTDRQRATADREAAHAARERGHKHWEQIKHPCGRAHAITDDKVAARVFKRLVDKQPDLNIGAEIGASRCVVVDADTVEELRSFTELWAQRENLPELADAAPTVRSPGVMRLETDEAGAKVENWVHKGGGHYWFSLPEHIDLTGAGTSKAMKIGAREVKASLMFRDQLVLVPPSVRAEGPYTMASDLQPAPAWLIDELLLHIAGHTLRTEQQRERALSGDSPIEAWAAITAWDDMLARHGWTTSGRIDNCGCEIWTRPGDWSSPKSATAHEPGCLKFEDTSGFLHLWTDNPPAELTGAKDWSKLQFLAAMEYGSTNTEAIRETIRDLGITSEHSDPTVLGKSDREVYEGLSEPSGTTDHEHDSATDHEHDSATDEDPKPQDVDPIDALLAELISAGDLDKIPKPVPLIDGILDRNTLVRIIGTSGHGKTFVMIDIASHIALGLPWLGRECSQGNVVYMVAEGVSGIRARVRSWESLHKTELGGRAKFLPRAVQVMNQNEWLIWVAAMARIRPTLIVIDTQARITVGANENDAKDMGVLVDRAELLRAKTGACVALIHHKGRQGDHGRGSTVVPAALDVEISVTKQGRSRITVVSEKQKDREDFSPISLDLVSEGESAVIVAAGTDKPFERSGVDEKSPIRDRVAKWVHLTFRHGNGATKGEVWTVVKERDRGPEGKPMSRSKFYEAWGRLEADEVLLCEETDAGKRWTLDLAEAIRLGLDTASSGSPEEPE